MAEFLLVVRCGRLPSWQRFVNSTGHDLRSWPRVAARGGLPRCTDLSILDSLVRIFVTICGRARRCKVPTTNIRVLVGIILKVAGFPRTHVSTTHGWLDEATVTHVQYCQGFSLSGLRYELTYQSHFMGLISMVLVFSTDSAAVSSRACPLSEMKIPSVQCATL